MNFFSAFLIFLLLFSCKKEEKIVFEFPKNMKMKFEKFNEGEAQMGSGVMYIGKPVKALQVRYFDRLYSDLTAPPPPRGYLDPATILKQKKADDSAIEARKPYFYEHDIPQLNKAERIDTTFFNNKNLEISILKDTIPLYRYPYDTGKINTYKAFPIILKNISQKSVQIPTLFFFKSIYFRDDKNRWQSVRCGNEPLTGCFPMPFVPIINLQPGQIVVYAVPYFPKGKNYKVRAGISGAYSDAIDLQIDAETIEGQHGKSFLNVK